MAPLRSRTSLWKVCGADRESASHSPSGLHDSPYELSGLCRELADESLLSQEECDISHFSGYHVVDGREAAGPASDLFGCDCRQRAATS